AIAHAKSQDEPDPRFAVTGSGPGTGDQQRQLKETGWIPYSVKIGTRYYSYVNTPLAIPLAVLGNFFDAMKYKHLDSTDALNHVDQFFDPKIYDAQTVEQILVNQVPFARAVNKPAINVMGEPVQKYLSARFVSDEREAALWKMLARKQAWVPVPDRETVIGK